MKNRIVVILFIFVCLSGGVFLYWTTRSESIYLNQWTLSLVNTKVYHFLQASIQNTYLPKWVIYSLPDALWMMALTLLILLIWDFKLNARSIPWVAIAIISGILFETSQAFHIVQGTFDVSDLMFMALGALVPISITLLKVHS